MIICPQNVYLVTGCVGFIGYHTTKNLLDKGHKVLGIDSMYPSPDLLVKEWRLSQLIEKNGFIFHRFDFCDMQNNSKIFTDTVNSLGELDAVIHLGGRAGVRQSVDSPYSYYDSNVLGTLNLLEFCRDFGVKKFIFASSSSLYSSVKDVPFSENANTDRTISPYAASKKAAEELCFTYHYLHGIDITIFRFFSVYGPAGRPDMSPFRFVQAIIENIPLTFYGNGTQQRDFTYVEDIVNGIVKGLKPLGYDIINLGSGKPISLKNLVCKIESITGNRAQICYSKTDQADTIITHACIKKAYGKIDWEPKNEIDYGLKKCVEWYEEERSWLRQLIT